VCLRAERGDEWDDVIRESLRLEGVFTIAEDMSKLRCVVILEEDLVWIE
jgi:hypothetical protein